MKDKRKYEKEHTKKGVREGFSKETEFMCVE
jgi:hypothetical protein